MPSPQLPNQCMSSCIIDDTLASSREGLFTKYKQPLLSPLVPSKSEDAGIPIDLNKFLNLLIQFRDSPKAYSGMRIYFATCLDQAGSVSVPAGREGHMTLIIVPTLPLQGKIARDDASSYYHLYDQLAPLPAPLPVPSDSDPVSKWIGHFCDDRRNVLQNDGTSKTPGFRETCSLWYPMSTIAGTSAGPGSGDIGMINAIQCGMNYEDNPIISLSAQYACFCQNEVDMHIFPYYQMTVIFDLHQKNDPIKGKVGFGSIGLLGLAPADTGVPCPPAGSCPPPDGGFPPPTP
jgi:hypothetical protein